MLSNSPQQDSKEPPSNRRTRRAVAALKRSEIGARIMVSHANSELLTGNNMMRVKRFVRLAGRPVYRLGRSDVVFLDDVVAALEQSAAVAPTAAAPDPDSDAYTEADALAELGCKMVGAK